MTHLIGAESLSLRYPTTTVFDGVSVSINAGDRIGIIGANGAGKSSLLAMLAGRLRPDSGRVSVRNGLRIGFLDQSDDHYHDQAVRIAVVGQRPDHQWASDPAIRDILDGLIADIWTSEHWNRPVCELSGGQRRRVRLAALLINEWDILALDEPTNHLDLAAIHWLADHLRQRWAKKDGGLIVISHDRWFFDEIAQTTWEVHRREVYCFPGGYSAYILARLERERQQQLSQARYNNLLRKELAWLHRGARARSSKPKFRLDAAKSLLEQTSEHQQATQLAALPMARLGKDVIDLVEVSFSYGDRQVLAPCTLHIAPGERVGILGANGAGKSTLLGLITLRLTPTHGHIRHGQTVRLGFFDQHCSHLDHNHQRVADFLHELAHSYRVQGRDYSPTQLLERLGFDRDNLATPIYQLSGGQRRRLQFLLVLLEEPNVLVLDEPTNDVDLEMLRALEDLLDGWAGTLIVVSHDRYLLDRITDHQYGIIDTHLRHLPGGIDQYLQLITHSSSGGNNHLPSHGGSGGVASGDDSVSSSHYSGGQRHLLEKERSRIERRLEKLSAQIDHYHHQLVECSHTGQYHQSTHLGEQLHQTRDQVHQLEQRWLEISEILES